MLGMKQSKLFSRTLKEAPKDEISANARLLIRGGFIDKLMAGVYTYLPLGFRVFKKIENIIREEMIEADGQELLMPSLHPKENWEKTGRWNTLDSLFRFVSHYTKMELALGPTHEEIISPLVKKFNLSHRDLPLYLFQFQNKFRDEKRAKSGILRAREFAMKDLYSFHRNEKEMEEYYESMKPRYKNIFNKCGIADKTYLTFASGGSFAKYSHEYQTVTSAGEDIIYICAKCDVAANKEIMEEKPVCPQCGSNDLREEKAVEVGNIFKLKDRFSQPFDLNYMDEKGENKPVLMGCYGIGLGRLMGTIVEINNDEKGIIWPESVAPFKVHLIELKSDNTEVKKEAELLFNSLARKNVEVLYDDRESVTTGQKFAEADLMGLPYRIVVSGKTLAANGAEVKGRREKEARIISLGDVINNF
ncbi:prolyl-tRNA synthetase [Candidatus Parcubacteria bacterium]|nr:MAG: prolyl-tRNA synthetase [Candidatus Parcubacteria bacterium]